MIDDIEVKTIIDQMFSPGDLENQFIKIYKQGNNDKKQFDENKSFFKHIKTIKLLKIQEICSSNFVFSRARRYVARMFQDFLQEKCGQKFKFQIMNKLFKINEILLTDRK